MIWGNLYWKYIIFIGSPIILILCFLVILFTEKVRRRRFSKFADVRYLDFYFKGFISFFWNLRTFIWSIALILMLVALANPKWGKKETNYTRSGVDIIYLLDISKSMDVKDVSPSRLERSLSLISILSNRLNGDRIALITFAGEANTVFSFTDNVKIANALSSVVNTDDVNVMGTNIAAALYEANELKDRVAAENNVVLFLFSDGENLEKSEKQIMEQVDVLARKGVTIHTIGVGTPRGQYLTSDNSIISKLNEGLLTRIAKRTEGKYISLNKDNKALSELEKIIADYDKNRYSSDNPLLYKEQFWFPLLLALILLLIESFIPYSKRTKLDRYISNSKEG